MDNIDFLFCSFIALLLIVLVIAAVGEYVSSHAREEYCSSKGYNRQAANIDGWYCYNLIDGHASERYYFTINLWGIPE